MIHAYDELYLGKAETSLGSMLDFVTHNLHKNPVSFFTLFIASGIAERFEKGDVRLIAGTSGIELAYMVLEQCGQTEERIRPRFTNHKNKETLCGEAIAYYQWKTDMSFAEIIELMPINEILEICDQCIKERRMKLLDVWPPRTTPFTLEEEEVNKKQDIETICRVLDENLLNRNNSSTDISSLKRIRQNSGLSQSRLAAASGVPLRTIQQYEQRQKNINKAQVDSIIRLAAVLHCEPIQLLEQ